MNTFRFDKEQRQAWVLAKLNDEKSVRRICHEAGISRATLYNWVEEFPDAKEAALKARAEEALLYESRINAPDISLKKSVSGRYEMLLKALTQADADNSFKKKLVQLLVKRFTLTVSAACELVALDEEAYGYRPRKPEEDDRIVYDEISRLLEEDKTRSFKQCSKLLQELHPGWPLKQIKRLWGEKKVYLQRARTRRQSTKILGKPALQRLQRPGASWRLGYAEMPGTTPEWVLFIVDDADGTPLNALSGKGNAGSEEVINLLVNATTDNGAPRKIILAGKPPFNSREITIWVWEQKIALQTLSMGKPENEASFKQYEDRVQAELLAAGFGDEHAEKQVLLDGWLTKNATLEPA